jgi:isopenicillin-N N-acyltransferase like protein
MIPLIETGGSPYEIGHDVGNGVRDALRAAMAEVRARYERRGASEAMVEAAAPFVAAVERLAPECLDELRGMAAGAGVPFEDLLLANADDEIEQTIGLWREDGSAVEAGKTEGCTVVGITQAGTADGHVLLAHNEDATAGWADYAYAIRAEPDGEPAFVAFSYAGLLLHQGINAAGLGSVGNALYASDARPGIPKLFLYRRALRERTIEGAIRAATHPARAWGNNHLFANAEGDVYDVEVSANEWALLHAGNRFLAHANHFVSPELRRLDADQDLLNSRLRLARVERLVEGAWGRIDLAALQEIMADHSNYPKSVCKHHAPESELDYGTIGSVVIDVTARVVRVCAGNPCRGEWREVGLGLATA